MPNRWAVANGNWSSTATWNSGGSLGIPTGSDDIFSNTFTVNVDQSFSVLSLNTTATTGVTAGGTFNFNSGSISGSVNSIGQGSGTTPLTISATTGTVTITSVSNINSVTSTPTVSYTGNCNLTMTAPTFNGNQGATGTSNIYTIAKSSSGTITLNGNVVGGNSAGSAAGNTALFSNAGNTIINGNVSPAGSSGGNGNPNYAINQSAGTLTINGSVNGGSQSTLGSVLFTGTTLTINGIITGGSTTVAVSTTATNINVSGSIVGGAGAIGLTCSSAATISITGPITPSSTATALSLSGASVLTYSGSLTSANNVPAIISSNVAATNIFTGPFINTNDTMAVQCVDMNLTADASTSWNFGNITLFSPERLAFYPSASDIRQGTTYADGTVSGSLAMPPATAVIAGTPTDNTTGSAVLTPAQLQDAVWGRDLSQMTETGSIGNRLARVSTTGTTGAQIASYLL
jgi:hypothetical protein